MKNRKMHIFGIALIYLLSVTNSFNIPWTYWLVKEQCITGWGNGTNMDILVLVPWIVQIACIPVAVAALAYFILSYVLRSDKKVIVTNIILFAALCVQSLFINLFIWY